MVADDDGDGNSEGFDTSPTALIIPVVVFITFTLESTASAHAAGGGGRGEAGKRGEAWVVDDEDGNGDDTSAPTTRPLATAVIGRDDKEDSVEEGDDDDDDDVKTCTQHCWIIGWTSSVKILRATVARVRGGRGRMKLTATESRSVEDAGDGNVDIDKSIRPTFPPPPAPRGTSDCLHQ